MSARSNRAERLMPNDVPKYVRCYFLGGYNSEYIIVFTRMGRTGTNRYSHKGKGYPYLQAKKGRDWWVFEDLESKNKPYDQTVDFYGTQLNFQDLSPIIRQEVRDMYIKLWKIA